MLIFGLTHSPVSRPWHLVSALVGVTCQKLVANPILASSLAIAMAVASLRDRNPFYPELEPVIEQKNTS
jgi:CBS-domain-containing membrane protein